MRVLIFAASLRAGSWNKSLARIAAARLTTAGVDVDHADFHEFEVPLFNQDVQDTTGFPDGMLRFNARLKAADAFAIVTPEYNFSIPGTLKNLIDWSSRERPIVFRGKPGLLLGASPSRVGAQRSLWALRVPLESLGACLYPDMFSLAQADQKLGPDRQLTDEKLSTRLDAVLAAFLAFASALTRQ
jgi:NAD(P)H-dependent FMN reductase